MKTIKNSYQIKKKINIKLCDVIIYITEHVSPTSQKKKAKFFKMAFRIHQIFLLFILCIATGLISGIEKILFFLFNCIFYIKVSTSNIN
jgi:hypothetical protein